MANEGAVQDFQNLPNFRQITIDKGDDSPRIMLKLYRSSRPDFLTPPEVDKFNALGIKSIVDFRSATDYRHANGPRPLDNLFPAYKLKIPTKKYAPNSALQMKKLTIGKPCDNLPDDCGKKHFFVDFFKLNYIWAIFQRAPWYVQLWSLVLALVDVILDTGFKFFVRIFARNVLNDMGLTKQYFDFVDHSQASIYAALTLLCDPANTPALVNCAHGKDRTGVVCALLQGCLGASPQQIMEDYAQSEVNLSPIADRVRREIVDHFHMSEAFLETKQDTMKGLLDYINKNWGSVANYLESIGFGREAQEKLRTNLVIT